MFQVLLGVAAAILLNQNFVGRALVRSITLIPWVIPGIVAATTWAWMFHTEFGIINYMLTSTGALDESVGWLTRGNTVMPAMIAINVWKLFPFVAIMVLAGLQSIPQELYEAARIDGANYWDEVRHIMLPQIRPVITAVTLLLVIWALNAITIIYAITKGGPANRTLITPIQIFRLAFENVEFNQAAALSVMFFGVVMLIVLAYIKTFRQPAGRATSESLGDGLAPLAAARPQPAGDLPRMRPARRRLPVPVRVDGPVLDQAAAMSSTPSRRSGGRIIRRWRTTTRSSSRAGSRATFSTPSSSRSARPALLSSSPCLRRTASPVSGSRAGPSGRPASSSGSSCPRRRSSCRSSSR